MSLVIQSDQHGLVCRLLDGIVDNPNELSLVKLNDGRIGMVMVDRDSGNKEMTLDVQREDLIAALAVLDTPIVGVVS